jgi:hypothetical protein
LFLSAYTDRETLTLITTVEFSMSRFNEKISDLDSGNEAHRPQTVGLFNFKERVK